MLSYNQIVLPYEIVDCIGDYISMIEKQNMKYLCKEYYNKIKLRLSNFEKILMERLNKAATSETSKNDHLTEKFGEKLIELIKNSNGLIQIGGSTVPQCLFNELREESDIDIYITYDDTKINVTLSRTSDFYDMFSSQEHIGKIFDLIRKTKLKEDIGLEICGPTENYMIQGYHVNYYDSTNSNENKEIIIQLIFIPFRYDKDEIYDFTFCRNNYDGKNVYSFNKQDVMNKRGKMNKWDKIYEKAVYTNGCTEARVCEHMLLRINKYINRGYQILNYEKRLNQINDEIKRCILSDYEDKSFNIIKITNSQFNAWLTKQHDTLGGVGMATRTIEIEFQSDNNNYIVFNNKGNPVVKPEGTIEENNMKDKRHIESLTNQDKQRYGLI